MIKGNFTAFYLFILFTFAHLFVFAGIETTNARLQGSAINSTAILTAKDSKMNGTTWYTGFTDKSNYIKIEFGIDEFKKTYYSTAFSLTANFDYRLTDAANNVTTFTGQQLSVNYDPDKKSFYTNKSQITKSGFYKVEVFNITITNASGISLNDMYIETEVSSERYYDFNKASAQIVNTDILNLFLSASNELEVSWNFFKGAEQYELEWTYVDNYEGTIVSGSPVQLLDNLVNYDLLHSSTRIITQNNYYRIPLNYENGYIIYRVRPVGVDASTMNRLDGLWNTVPDVDNIASIKALPDFTHFLYNVNALESDEYNWSSQLTFAEQGKMGAGLGFKDGLGFNRQTLARLNTESKTIVSTPLYDHFGRSPVNILPAPVSGKDFNFRNGLNKYEDPGTTILYNYDKNIFDICTSCIGTGSGININAPFPIDPEHSLGASNYYSSYNSNQQSQQAYLPDAKSFPFTQVEFMPDQSGRIKRMTMPGKDLKLGSNKETKFFYVKPTQVELDQLFGAEAGRSINYRKNYVVDPNGQVSVSYIDGLGRIVATALTGNGPSNLSQLLSNSVLAEQLNTEDLIPYNDVDPKNYSWSLSTPFYVVSPNEEQIIQYSTTFSDYLPSDCNNTLCLDCIYDLEISILDECGLEIFDHDNDPGTPAQSLVVAMGGSAPYDGTCNESNTYAVTPHSHSVFFTAPGQYTLIKKLKVSEKPIQTYKDLYLQNDECHKTLTEIQNEFLADIDFSGCFNDCESCEASVDAYVAASLVTGSNLPQLTTLQIQEMKNDCQVLCKTIMSNCTDMKVMLANMFYPGMPYALYDEASSGPYAATDPYSVLNTSGTNLLGIDYTQAGPYYNDDGSASTFLIGGLSVGPEDLSIKDFVDKWQDSWAQNFVSYHPEYCKYQWYCKMEESFKYDDEMLNVETFSEACAQGFLNPVSGISLSGCTTVSNPDPTFVNPNTMLNSTEISTFISAVSPYNHPIYPGLNIFEVVLAELGLSSTYTFGSDICTQDIEWRRFRDLYIYKKKLFLAGIEADFYTNYSSMPGHGACFAVPSGYPELFTDPDVLSFPGSPNIDNSSSSTTISSAVSTAILQNCSATCLSYAENFATSLASCTDYIALSSADKTQLIDDLVQVCMRGCDVSHPAGSSDYPASNPGQTPTPAGPIPYLVGTPGTAVYSFQDVLTHYGLTPTDPNCSAFAIANPRPYSESSIDPVASGNILDKCGCDKILAVDYDFTNNINVPSGVTTAKDLFYERHKIDLKDFNMYNCACKSAVDKTTPATSWSPTYQWDSNALNELINSPVPVAAEFGCENCINCEKLQDMEDLIKTEFGLGSNIDYVQYLIDNPASTTTLLNNTYNLGFTNTEYIAFFSDCESWDNNRTIKNLISPEGFAVNNFLVEAVNHHHLTTDHVMSMGNSSAFFNSALFTGNIIPLPTNYNYNVTFAGGVGVTSQITIAITNPPSNTYNCSIDLFAPSGTTIDFSTITALSNFRVDFVVGTSGYSQKFKVTATIGGTDYTLTGTTTCYKLAYGDMDIRGLTPKMCEQNLPAPLPLDPCMQNMINTALDNAQTEYDVTLINDVNEMIRLYKEHCFTNLTESMERQYPNKEYHFTLYYYDQAGDLVRTVAPNGVVRLPINTSLPLMTTTYPDHGTNTLFNKQFVTQYKYNSLGATVQNHSVDGGTSTYYYDKPGRIVASQNEKQYGNLAFSYSLYDEMSRITETGEVVFINPVDATLTESIAEDPALFTTFLNAGVKSQVSHTYYDDPLNSTINSQFIGGQKNLRNRVSTITFEQTNDSDDDTYNFATHFSYDRHGNVHRVVNETTELTNLQGQRYKTVDYEYDLISGNTNKIIYQAGQPDYYVHTYSYDDDNRLHEVLTSRDGVNWQKDGKYFYYEHGPLARTEIGEEKVQGIDYAYTIQGWMKVVNSELLLANSDHGKDGSALNNYNSLYTGLHKQFAKDAYGYSLGYFTDPAATTPVYDYEAISDASFNTSTNIKPFYNAANLYNNSAAFDLATDAPVLYNGNINSMVTSFIDIDAMGNIAADNVANPLITAYKYDQLNRLAQHKAFNDYRDLAWELPVSTNFNNGYFTALTYDANGNILTHQRAGPGNKIVTGSSLLMDDLQYHMVSNSVINTNKLDYVDDNTAYSGNYGTDIDDQASGNYDYDAIGNLIHNKEDCIDEITYTVDRKVKSITRLQSELIAQNRNLDDIEYEYDAMRRRSVKIIKPRDATTHDLKSQDNWRYTYYSYDASGNLLATYERTYSNIGTNEWQDEVKLNELNIFGSGRLGTDKGKEQAVARTTFDAAIVSNVFGTKTDIVQQTIAPALPANITQNVLGKKLYELSNHLGNVIVTLSDRKLQDNYGTDDVTTTGIVDYYSPDLYSNTDYYPFGSPMQGRNYSSSVDKYRFGFNGKENDIETNEGIQDFGAREYNGRLGRFFTLDPDKRKYPFMTPYCFAANNPIRFIDVDGKGPGDPPGPFKVTLWGDWYAIGYVTTDYRKVSNVTNEIYYAVTAVPGALLEISENIYENVVHADKGAAIEVIRDGSIELHEQLLRASDLVDAADNLGDVGTLFDLYDIYSELKSNKTREEVLTDFTIKVAQNELYAQKAPSSSNTYLHIPKDQFDNPEEATNRLNQIYNTIDQMLSGFDLSDPEDFKIAEDILYKTPGLNFNKIFNGTIFTSPSGTGTGTGKVPTETVPVPRSEPMYR